MMARGHRPRAWVGRAMALARWAASAPAAHTACRYVPARRPLKILEAPPLLTCTHVLAPPTNSHAPNPPTQVATPAANGLVHTGRHSWPPANHMLTGGSPLAATLPAGVWTQQVRERGGRRGRPGVRGRAAATAGVGTPGNGFSGEKGGGGGVEDGWAGGWVGWWVGACVRACITLLRGCAANCLPSAV